METLKEILKKIACFAVLCIAVLSIGSTMYLFYFKKPLFGIVNIFLTVFAIPCIAAAWDILWNGKDASLFK